MLGPYNTVFVEATPSAKIQGAAYVSPIADSTAEFSGTQGVNGWSYGYLPLGNVNSFTLLPVYNAQSQWWQHTTFGPPWTIVGAGSGLHPNGGSNGPEEWATRRWTSTFSGAARITGQLAKIDTNPASTGVYGRIYLNHSLIYEHFVSGTDGTGVYYSVPATLKAGDVLDFAVAPNGEVSNDSTLFYSLISTSMPAVSGNMPAISSVVNSASGQEGIAPGTYMSIYGLNFAAAGFVDDWSKSVVGGKLPTKLDGVSVSFGGQAAYVVAVTASQINVLTPNIGMRSVPVTVTTEAGTSAPFVATAQAIEPGLFSWPGGQAVASHLDFTYAVKNG